MYDFKNLVFEGGGVKGIAYGGALQKLDEFGIISNIERVAGTSAGAITATLLAIGYSALQVSNILAESNFSKFPDGGLDIFDNSRRLFKNYGWHKGEEFESWMENHIEFQTGNKKLTFKELHELKKKGAIKTYRDLYVVGSNLSKQSTEIFCHETTPNMEIRNAVRISMSIPFYFQCVRLNGDVLVDGGLTLNYPIFIFDHERYLFNPKNCEKLGYVSKDRTIFNHETLGLKLNGETSKNSYRKIDNLLDYTYSIISLMNQTAQGAYLHRNDWKRSIYIDASIVAPTDFNVSKDKVYNLIENGKTSAERYIAWTSNSKKNFFSKLKLFKLRIPGIGILRDAKSIKEKNEKFYPAQKTEQPIGKLAEKKFEKFMHEQAPMTKYLNFKVEKFDVGIVKISAPFAADMDHKPTAFVGSINALTSVCGWAMVFMIIKEYNENPHITLLKSSVDYLLPINKDFSATCETVDGKKVDKFIKSYSKWGKSQVEVEVVVYTPIGAAAKFKGVYEVSK